MLEHFNISNFLVFKELQIPQLKRINLFAGKNNTGKTALLQALRIYFAEKDAATVVNNILYSRGLLSKGDDESYRKLFNKEKLLEIDLLYNEIELKFNEIQFEYRDTEKIFGKKDEKRGLYRIITAVTHDNPKDKCIYVPYQSTNEKLGELWDKIALTPLEDDVITIIKNTIQPDLVRFVITNNTIKFRLEGMEQPIPIETLGDGVKRMLLVAISLASAKNSYLLIDEIEMGLHHTVLEKLWKMIFHYAKLWNIQVFATTHSQDAIRTFYYRTQENNNEKEAQFIRLQHNRAEELEAVIYDSERLSEVLDLELEIR